MNEIEAYDALRTLPKKKRLFVENYVVYGLPPYRAGIKAGLNPSSVYQTVSKYLKDPKVKEAIDALRENIKKEYQIDKDYFIIHLKGIIEDRITKVSDKISALTLLARITGHIKEQPPQPKQLVILKQEGLGIEKSETIIAEEISSEN